MFVNTLPEPFGELFEELQARCADIGLYVEDAVLLGTEKPTEAEGDLIEEPDGLLMAPEDIGADLVGRMRGGSLELGFAVQFTPGRLAWDDRTLNPDQFAVDELLQSAGLTEEEQRRNFIQEQLDQGVSLGDINLDLFELDNTEETENG